jgi:hypothetical protein
MLVSVGGQKTKWLFYKRITEVPKTGITAYVGFV